MTPIMGKSTKEGINLKHKGDYDTALGIFEGNLQKNPKDALALYGKAWILAEKGQRPEATTTFKSFLGVSKDATKVKEAKAAISRMKSAGAAPSGGAPTGMGGGKGGPGGGPGGGMGGPGGPGGPGGGPGGPGGPPGGGPGGPGGPPGGGPGGPGGPPAGGPGGPPK